MKEVQERETIKCETPRHSSKSEIELCLGHLELHWKLRGVTEILRGYSRKLALGGYGGDRLKNKDINNCKLTRIRAGKSGEFKSNRRR